MRKITLIAILATATACTPVPDAQVTKARPVVPAGASVAFVAPALAPEAGYAPVAGRASHGDAEVAATFMDLTFAMESGRQLPTFSRFEGTIKVAMTGDVPGTAVTDLSRLMTRLRNEAGIDVRAAVSGDVAGITIDFRPKAELRRLAPNAACFVVPNVSSLAEYKAKRGTVAVDWANVAQRRQVAIFVPSDASPQEVRDCLHEEMAQAMGPLNDLYRLPDSVFNDDNFNSVLTDFDMTILRAYYAPDLRSGMSRSSVAALIPGIVAQVNTGGPGMGGADLSVTPRSWTQAIETALGGGAGQAGRRSAAERALDIARAQGWTDGRLAFSHFAIARLYVGSDRTRAAAEFAKAAAIYRGLPGGALHVAHIDMQLAAIALASGQAEDALRLANRAIPAVRAAENHAMQATLMLLKAEALDQLGRGDEAERLRVDSQTPARYGFGSDAQIRLREREISALGGRLGKRG